MMEKGSVTLHTAGLLGAGVAFAVSGLIVGVFPALLTSYTVFKWLYALGLAQWLIGEEAFAGRFPDPLSMMVGRLLLLLALLSCTAAALSALLGRGPNV